MTATRIHSIVRYLNEKIDDLAQFMSLAGSYYLAQLLPIIELVPADKLEKGSSRSKNEVGLLKFLRKTYTPSGFDYIKGTINYETLTYQNDAYILSPITFLATFLGLPSYLGNLAKKQSWDNIGLQLIGWNETRKLWLNILSLLVFFPFNILTSPFKLAVNIAKIVTEVLPHLVKSLTLLLCAFLIKFAAIALSIPKEEYKGNPFTLLLPILMDVLGFISFLFLSLVSVAVLVVIALASSIWYYIGRSLTSPLDAVRGDWKYWSTDFSLLPNVSWLLNPLRPLLVVIRVLTIATAYGILCALALPAIVASAPFVASFFAAHAPVLLLLALKTAATAIPVTVPFLTSLSPLALQALVSGTLAGLLIASVGAALKTTVSKFTNWLHDERPDSFSSGSDTPNAARKPGPAPLPRSPDSGDPAASASLQRTVNMDDRDRKSSAQLSTPVASFNIRHRGEPIEQRSHALGIALLALKTK